jgi:hypothetical protein
MTRMMFGGAGASGLHAGVAIAMQSAKPSRNRGGRLDARRIETAGQTLSLLEGIDALRYSMAGVGTLALSRSWIGAASLSEFERSERAVNSRIASPNRLASESANPVRTPGVA